MQPLIFLFHLISRGWSCGGEYISLKIRFCPRPGDFMVQPFYGKPPGSSRSASPGEQPQLLQEPSGSEGLSHAHLPLEGEVRMPKPPGPRGSLPASQAWQNFPNNLRLRELQGM